MSHCLLQLLLVSATSNPKNEPLPVFSISGLGDQQGILLVAVTSNR